MSAAFATSILFSVAATTIAHAAFFLPPHGASLVQSSYEYRIAVTREGFSGGVDELAERVAQRFGAQSVRVRLDLQRSGRFDVPGQGSLATAQRVIDELRSIGVPAVVVEVPAVLPPVPLGLDDTFMGEIGGSTFVTPSASPTPLPGASDDRTLHGMPREGADGRTLVPGRGPAVIPESDGVPEGQEKVPGAWQAVLGAASPVPTRAAAPPVRPDAPPPVALAPPAAIAAMLGDATIVTPPPPLPVPPPVSSGPAVGLPASAPSNTAAEATPQVAAARGWSAVLGHALHERPVGAPEPTPPPASPTPSAGATPSSAPPRAFVVPDALLGDDAATQMVMPSHPRQQNDAARNDLLEAQARPRQRYERLRQAGEPSQAASDEASPLVAGIWSLLAPGAGQAYNGQVERGVTFALAGVFIVPWFWSIADAVQVATARQRKPKSNVPGALKARLAIVAGFWTGIAVLLFLAGAVRDAAERNAVRPVFTTQVGLPTAPAAPPTHEASGPEIDDGPARQRAAQRLAVAELVDRARLACLNERFVECRDLAEQALELDDSSREAQTLHVQAIAATLGPTAQDTATGDAAPTPPDGLSPDRTMGAPADPTAPLSPPPDDVLGSDSDLTVNTGSAPAPEAYFAPPAGGVALPQAMIPGRAAEPAGSATGGSPGADQPLAPGTP